MPPLQTTHTALVDHEIANDAFWGGAINVQDWQEAYRIPASIAPTTVARRLEMAIDEVNADLTEWREAQEEDGIEALTAAQQRQYTEAVFALAYAKLTPFLKALFATDQAEGIGEDLDDNEKRFHALSEGAVKRITGRKEPGGMTLSVL